jgi:hypothetical protein
MTAQMLKAINKRAALVSCLNAARCRCLSSGGQCQDNLQTDSYNPAVGLQLTLFPWPHLVHGSLPLAQGKSSRQIFITFAHQYRTSGAASVCAVARGSPNETTESEKSSIRSAMGSSLDHHKKQRKGDLIRDAQERN